MKIQKIRQFFSSIQKKLYVSMIKKLIDLTKSDVRASAVTQLFQKGKKMRSEKINKSNNIAEEENIKIY